MSAVGSRIDTVFLWNARKRCYEYNVHILQYSAADPLPAVERVRYTPRQSLDERSIWVAQVRIVSIRKARVGTRDLQSKQLMPFVQDANTTGQRLGAQVVPGW